MGGPEGEEGIRPEWRAALAAWAKGREEVQALWAFGSRARGAGRPDSDLDIAIRTQAETASESFGEWIGIAHSVRAELAALNLGVELSPHWGGPGWDQERVWPAVLREGVLLFERWPGAGFEDYPFPDINDA